MALHFQERVSGIDKYPNVDPASWAPFFSDFSDPTTAESWSSTPTTNGNMLRRGAVTDLIEQVGDALAAPRVASVAARARGRHACGSRKVCGQKCRSVRSGVRNRKYQSVSPHQDSGQCPGPHAPQGHRPPTVWGLALWSKILSMRGAGEAHARKPWKSGSQDGLDFYVTSEARARAGCELAY